MHTEGRQAGVILPASCPAIVRKTPLWPIHGLNPAWWLYGPHDEEPAKHSGKADRHRALVSTQAALAAHAARDSVRAPLKREAAAA